MKCFRIHFPETDRGLIVYNLIAGNHEEKMYDSY